PEDILFVCAKCHRELDRERAFRDRQLAARRHAERRRRARRRFRRPFKQIAWEFSGGYPHCARWCYRHFIHAWKDCIASSYGNGKSVIWQSQDWFLCVHKFMLKEDRAAWFTSYSFETAEWLYVDSLEHRRDHDH